MNNHFYPKTWRLLLLALLLCAGKASAQANDQMTPIASPDQSQAIALGTPALPGAKAQESWHSQYGSRFVRNVTVATLTPVLPAPGKASGAAVIVAPGGGFRTLSMDNEGWDVANALAKQGIAAFVLKYRLNQTPADMAGFQQAMAELFSGAARRPPRPNQATMATELSPQLEDARAAFALVRSRAKEWQVDPKRIGMIGHADDGNHAGGQRNQTGFYRQYLWPARCGGRTGGCATAVYCARR